VVRIEAALGCVVGAGFEISGVASASHAACLP
jgi:hypothetical protein